MTHVSPLNCSGISRKRLVGRLLRFPLKLVPRTATMPILQGTLRGYRWIAGAHTHGCWLGSYELDKQKIFEQYVHRDAVVYDIGANTGFYSLLASALTGPKGRVIAFEPLPRNLGYLQRHIKLNQLINVEVMEAAVMDRVGVVHFDDAAGSATGRVHENGKLEVASVSLDELVSDKRIPLPDLIKMDIEGGELDALRGAQRILREAQPIVLLATHGLEVHRACCELLKQAGYSIESIDGREIDASTELLAMPTGGKL